jgi:hypothetical protein
MLIFIKGLTTPPANVNNLEITTLNGTALLTWDLAPDVDVRENGSVLFRYSNELSGAVWENSVKLQTATSGQNTSVALPLLIGTYLAKFADSQGNQSVNATSIIVTNIANIIHMNSVGSIHQEPTFSGVKNNMVVVDDNLQFDVDGGDLYQFGSYHFDNYITGGFIQTIRAITNMSLNATNLADFISARPEVSKWESIANPPANVTVEMFISTTDDDPAGSPVWSPWKHFTIADYTTRAVKFKIEASADLNHQVQISELSVSIELPDKTETERQITSGTTTKTITYSIQFSISPIITITPVDMMTGDYFTISNESGLSFDINFYDSADVAVSRIFNYNSTGY